MADDTTPPEQAPDIRGDEIETGSSEPTRAEVQPRSLPSEVTSRLSGWFFWKAFWSFSHIALGITGIFASALAAANINQTTTRTAGLASAVIVGILAIVKPDRQSLRLTKALRILEPYADSFKYSLYNVDMKQLMDAKNKADEALSQGWADYLSESRSKPKSHG